MRGRVFQGISGGTSLRAGDGQACADARMGRCGGDRRPRPGGRDGGLRSARRGRIGVAQRSAFSSATASARLTGQIASNVHARRTRRSRPRTRRRSGCSAPAAATSTSTRRSRTRSRVSRNISPSCAAARKANSRRRRRTIHTAAISSYSPPAADGFATNSLFGFAALLTRAYLAATASAVGWDVAPGSNRVSPLSDTKQELAQGRRTDLGARDHGRPTRPGCPRGSGRPRVKVHGSRNREPALRGLAELRPRTASLAGQARRAERGGGPGRRGRPEARRTHAGPHSGRSPNLPHWPPGTPARDRARRNTSFLLTGFAGEARGTDPGRPGVPTFGRRLYALQPRNRARTDRGPQIAAIERKAFTPFETLTARGEAAFWRDAYEDFDARLRSASFAGAVLDYDGTIVDARHRFLPPTEDMVRALLRLIDDGLMLVGGDRAWEIGPGSLAPRTSRNAVAARHCWILQRARNRALELRRRSEWRRRTFAGAVGSRRPSAPSAGGRAVCRTDRSRAPDHVGA